jgi:hypothetical protein
MSPLYDHSKLRSRPTPYASGQKAYIALLDGHFVDTVTAYDGNHALDTAAEKWADGDDTRVEVALAGDH